MNRHERRQAEQTAATDPGAIAAIAVQRALHRQLKEVTAADLIVAAATLAAMALDAVPEKYRNEYAERLVNAVRSHIGTGFPVRTVPEGQPVEPTHVELPLIFKRETSMKMGLSLFGPIGESRIYLLHMMDLATRMVCGGYFTRDEIVGLRDGLGQALR